MHTEEEPIPILKICLASIWCMDIIPASMSIVAWIPPIGTMMSSAALVGGPAGEFPAKIIEPRKYQKKTFAQTTTNEGETNLAFTTSKGQTTSLVPSATTSAANRESNFLKFWSQGKTLSCACQSTGQSQRSALLWQSWLIHALKILMSKSTSVAEVAPLSISPGCDFFLSSLFLVTHR